MDQSFKIGKNSIGSASQTYVIAEVGFNHEGNVELGKEMIAAAASAGADAVKFQTYKASDLAFEDAPHYDLIQHGELDLKDHIELKKTADESGIQFLSTPFSLEAVDLLEEVGVPAYKVASMDVTFLPLLEKLAGVGKPILLSTGMATLGEIRTATDIIRTASFALLHCVSHYPPDATNANLKTISQLLGSFRCPIGYSDHVLGNIAATTAVALGACVIEKHFTTDKNLPGPDHKISADTAELSQLISEIRTVEATLGRACADDTRSDREQRLSFRRAIYATEDIPAGTVLAPSHIKYTRPEAELAPSKGASIFGRKTNTLIAKNHAVSMEHLK